jgi:hypothetical protein
VEIPEGTQPVPSDWVYNIEHDGAGNLQRFKASLACTGNHKIEGIDYQDTDALTARLGHIRQPLVISSNYDLVILQQDICTTFMETTWEMYSRCSWPREILNISRMVADTTIRDERLRRTVCSASENLFMAQHCIRTFGIARSRTL